MSEDGAGEVRADHAELAGSVAESGADAFVGTGAGVVGEGDGPGAVAPGLGDAEDEKLNVLVTLVVLESLINGTRAKFGLGPWERGQVMGVGRDGAEAGGVAGGDLLEDVEDAVAAKGFEDALVADAEVGVPVVRSELEQVDDALGDGAVGLAVEDAVGLSGGERGRPDDVEGGGRGIRDDALGGTFGGVGGTADVVHDVDLKGNVIADEESPAMMPEAVEVGQNPEVPPAEDDLDRAALGAHLTSLGATRADRTMESYALEFLHTAEANLVDAHKRVSASLTVDSIRLGFIYMSPWEENETG
jgi:hypothetical protein